MKKAQEYTFIYIRRKREQNIVLYFGRAKKKKKIPMEIAADSSSSSRVTGRMNKGITLNSHGESRIHPASLNSKTRARAQIHLYNKLLYSIYI